MTYFLVFVLVFVLLTATLAGLIYGLGQLIKWQANKPVKRFFAPIPRPGSFSFVVLEGRVVDIIENVVGWKLSTGNKQLFEPGSRDLGFWEKYLGVRWIGLFKTIRVFKDWRWTEFQQIGSNGTIRYEVVPRKEDVNEFFFQFSHPVVVEDAEIQGNIRVSVVALVTVLNLHPTRAFFLNKDPISLFAAMVASTIRTHVSNKTFNEVKEMVASAGTKMPNQEFWNVLKSLNGLESDTTGKPDYSTEDPLGIFGKLGEIIVRAEIIQVSAVGDTAAALEAKRLAELRGDAAITAATKAAEAVVAKARGDAEAMDMQREARERWVQGTIVAPTGGAGPHVANVLVAEQVAGSDITTWVTSGNAMVAIPPGEKPSK